MQHYDTESEPISPALPAELVRFRIYIPMVISTRSAARCLLTFLRVFHLLNYFLQLLSLETSTISPLFASSASSSLHLALNDIFDWLVKYSFKISFSGWDDTHASYTCHCHRFLPDLYLQMRMAAPVPNSCLPTFLLHSTCGWHSSILLPLIVWHVLASFTSMPQLCRYLPRETLMFLL